jgi:3-methylcrotonyl-CoA carboxylase alpha subunit
MNTRLQVEHPVTEGITGLDLVELQLRVASGERLPFAQDDLRIDGHAVEARLYAEDPERSFLPSTGKLWGLSFPEESGIRVDTGVRSGDEVTPFYDPMIAKVIAHGPDRDTALDRLSAALGDTVVAGPRTNTAFLRALCDAPDFRSGRFDTGFIDRNLATLTAPNPAAEGEAVAAGVLTMMTAEARRVAPSWRGDPWLGADGFQLMGERRLDLEVLVNGAPVQTRMRWIGGTPEIEIPDFGYRGRPELGSDEATSFDSFASGAGLIIPAGDAVLLVRDGRQTAIHLVDPFAVDLEHLDSGDSVNAPMHGKLVAVFVQPGERVEKGQRLAVVEAMKMEHALLSPRDGEVAEVLGEPGGQVAEGARLVVLAPVPAG